MLNAPKPDHVSLTTLVTRLREGQFVIPDFQREFEWQPWDIGDLVRSIFLDYYIGTLLLWRARPKNFSALACEPIYGYHGDGENPVQIVLDGQQRLTALYYVFVAPNIPLPNRANRFLYFIRVDRFIDEAFDEAFQYDWRRRSTDLLANLEEQFETHMFPVSLIGQGGWELPNWIQGYEKHWIDKESAAKNAGDEIAAQAALRCVENARAFGEHIKAITQQYQISYIELDRDLAIDKICDIFTKINSRGIRLDIFDLINALLKPKGLQLKHLWRDAAPRLEFADNGRMNVHLLQVMSILRQAYCSPKYLYYLLPGQERQVRDTNGSLRKEVLVPDIADFEKRWYEAVNAVEKSIKLLNHPQQFGAISARYLPYVSILPAFAALQASLRALPAPQQLGAQRKLRHWYWASVFTNRYSGAVESTSARDFLDVKRWFSDDDAEPDLIAEFRTRYRNLELRRETKRGTSVYNGIFNLLVLRGARDWVTGVAPQHDDLDDHHIVPKSWGKEQGLHGTIDSILNRTPLTSDTNRKVIRERLPNEYLSELMKSSSEVSVRATLESHFISPSAFAILLRDPFTENDFEEFITERQHTLQDAIESFLVKERLDLSPQLCDFNARIEGVELALRRCIHTALDNDRTLLPPHVCQKIDERLQVAVKKNPALDTNHHRTLEGMLEFADLRELQDIISNRQLWKRFSQRFVNKESLATRFGQLADIRNGIRHSRMVDLITRKDGETSILWFERVIGS